MAKHWTELSKTPHYVHQMRKDFLLEHRDADQIVISKEGIPLQAIYFSPEMPGYGKPRPEESRELIKPDLIDIEK